MKQMKKKKSHSVNRVAVRPELFRWAYQRAEKSAESLKKQFPKLILWEKGQAKPTLKQLERFAKAMHIPIGYFFLDKPPREKIPIPDFRKTHGKKKRHFISPNLLDTIYVCQRRQDWYRDYKQSMREKPFPFIGSVKPSHGNVVETAKSIRKILNFDIEKRKKLLSWKEALRQFIDEAISAGILVMISGIAANNTRRKLDPAEFRGFALSDSLAPLIFINGADTTAAQMFTLAHELAHLWINQTGLSDAQALDIQTERFKNHIKSGSDESFIETWCNKIAAELLVPLDLIKREANAETKEDFLSREAQRLARIFKVSSLVILRRFYDIGQISFQKFSESYKAELKKIKAIQKEKESKSSGGDFFLTLSARANPLFIKALTASALEGHTAFREAFQLLGIKKMTTFKKIEQEL